MFCTLRQSKDADESYAFQMHDPPFSKSKGKFGITACINCRASKAKCTGEPGGCQRCLSKARPCEYPDVRRRSRDQNNKHRSRSFPELPQVANDGEISAACEYLNQLGQDVVDVNMGFETITPPESIVTLPTTTVSPDGNIFIDMTPTSSMFSFASHMDAETWDTSNNSTTAITNTDSNNPFLNCGTTNETTEILTSIGTYKTCECFPQAMKIYETAEVNLVWGARQHHTDAMEMLQQQKRIITDTESLLDCPWCTGQSAFAMLLISLSSKLVSSVEHASHELLLGDVGGGTSSSSSDWGRHDALSFSVSNVTKRQLDEDDRRVVLASLSLRRVAKLHSLIGNIERLVIEHNWSTHRAMVLELKDRLRLVDI